MASFISPIREQRLTGSPKRQPWPGIVAGENRPNSRRDTLLLGTMSFRGDAVYDTTGKLAGEIDDLVLDLHSGRVAYALVTVGGFLGIGQKSFAVPWSAFTIDRAFQRCVINVDRQHLFDAPTFDGDIQRKMANTRWATELHAYFRCKPYWE